MSDAPRLVDLPARAYVAVSGEVTTDSFPAIADRLPEVFGWLGSHGLSPAGAPFFRYAAMRTSGVMTIEAGVPLPALPPDARGVLAAELPAGRYATTTYVGHPRGLRTATAALLDWGRDQGVTWAADGERWVARLEWLETDPRTQPDPEQWRTRLEILTRG